MPIGRYSCCMPTFCILFSAAGCCSQSFMEGTASGSGDLLAVKVPDYSGASALAARADAVTEESRTVLLPAELTQDTRDAVVIALTTASILDRCDGRIRSDRHCDLRGHLQFAVSVPRSAGCTTISSNG